MTELRCVIWDVDGTLVDSEALIQEAMAFAYDRAGLDRPDPQEVRGMVGLSLDRIFPQLSPQLGAQEHADLAQGYRDAYFHMRSDRGSAMTSPFYPGVRETLKALRAQDWTLMAVATGKSRRGLDKLIEGHGLQGWFQSEQTADHHPSKPHPAMIQAVLAETGVSAERAVMIGDTSYDMDMGRAAGVRTIGVGWGFHAVDRLNADRIVATPAALAGAIEEVLQ